MNLTSAVALARGGRMDWSHTETANLYVRSLSDEFVHGYLEDEWPEVGYCVESHASDTRDPLPHQIFPERVTFRDGYIHLTDKPGFGLDIDWKAVERHRA